MMRGRWGGRGEGWGWFLSGVGAQRSLKKKKKAEARKEEEGFRFYPKSSNVKRRSRRRWGNGVAKAGVDPWSLETGSETGIKQKNRT